MFNDFNPVDYFYLLCAVVGGLLFLARVGFGLLGGETGSFDGDMGEFNPGIDHPDAGHHGDPGFHLFSLQGITGFFIMFGLVGLAISRGGGEVFWSGLSGLVAGGATMVVIAWIFQSAQRLQSEGTLRIQNAVGKEGTVYLTIPEHGTGQVSVVVQGGLRQFDAISDEGGRIPTGEKVRVKRIFSGNVLVVERIA